MNNLLLGFALGIFVGVMFCTFVIWSKSLNRAEKIRPEVSEDQPLEINKDNPPRWMNYSPAALSHKAYCACHGERLVPGQKVLLWPATEKSSALFFCQEGVAEVIDQ